MKILVTGGCGFVGSNLVSNLAEENDITILDNLSRKGVEKNLEWLKRNYDLKFIKADIRDFNKVKKTVKDINAIYHTAGQVAVTTSMIDPREDFEINALGTLNVLEAARIARTDPTIIFTSTNKVYGENVNKIPLKEKETRYVFEEYENGIPEDLPLDSFHSPYGCSKLAADQYVKDYYESYGLKTVVFRMSCIYGKRQFGTEDQGWLAHFIISSVFGKLLTIYGDGKQVRDVLYIDDLVNAFRLATENIEKTKGQAYNIGGGPENTISLLELLSMLKKDFGLNPKYSFDEWRPSDQKVYISDIGKAKKEFGWAPQVSVRKGVSKLYNWVKNNKNLFK